MDLQRTLQRMIRIVFTYAAVGIILLICLCVGLWSAVESSIIHFFAFQRQNVPVVESGVGTSKDELQSSLKSTNPPSDDTTSKCLSPETYYDCTETVNTTEEKANKQTKNDQISKEENFSHLEGLALQIVHLEQCRISADLPRRTSCDFFESPNESLSVSKPARKGVLKSSSSETKPLPTRGTRRIRFQDPPVYDVSEGPSARFTSGKKSPVGGSFRSEQRKISPAPYLKTGLNFQESPAKCSKTKTCVTVQFPETIQLENAPVIDLSSETGSDQQLANKEMDSLEGSDSTIPTACSSEPDDSEPIANESLDDLSKELNSSTSLSSKIATNQQIAAGPAFSLSEEFNITNLSVLPSKTETNQQVCNDSMDTLTEDLSSTDSTALFSEIATNQQTTNKSMDPLGEDSNLTFPTTYKEFEESPKVEDQCSEQGRVEDTSELKSGERSLLEQSSEEISTQMRELKVEELHYESAVDEETKSSNKKEGNIHELSEKSESVNEGENLKEMNLLSESTFCQQSTKELINANVSESTSSNELNPTMLKTDKELCMSFESENSFKMENIESTVITGSKEASQEMITQRLSEMNVEQLLDDSTEERGWTSCSDEEESSKTEEGKYDVSQAVMAEDDDVLQSEVVTDQQSAEESTFL